MSADDHPPADLLSKRAQAEPYVTRDGSLIRELMHPARQAVAGQSLAEAEVAPGQATVLHRHRVTEEIYHVLEGEGEMRLGEAVFPVGPGDSICIPPGTAHRIANTGGVKLRFLCSCVPAYRHQDTELL